MTIKIGKILRCAIKSHKMTQKQIANKIHISPQVLSNYITDKRTPHLDCFFDLVDLLDLEKYFMYPHLSDKTAMNKYITKTIKSLTFEQLQLLYLIVKSIKIDK